MSGELRTLDASITQALVTSGDLRRLTPQQKTEYYIYRCEQIGVDPSARPFDLLLLNGKEVLYANAGLTQQLSNNRNLSFEVTGREKVDDLYIVYGRVTDKEGRWTEDMGAVSIGGMKADGLVNQLLKAQTKCHRRCVLAHCGLGELDESEIETIPAQAFLEYTPWTDQQLADAKLIAADLEQSLFDAGMSEEEALAAAKKYRNEIGEGTIENWCNRVAAASARKTPKPTLPAPPVVIPAAEALPPKRGRKPRPETAQEALTAQQTLKNEAKEPISDATNDFLDGLEPYEAIDADQYEALGILLEANGIDRNQMRAYCHRAGHLLPSKTPTLARMKAEEFAKFRSRMANAQSAARVAAIINKTVS